MNNLSGYRTREESDEEYARELLDPLAPKPPKFQMDITDEFPEEPPPKRPATRKTKAIAKTTKRSIPEDEAEEDDHMRDGEDEEEREEEGETVRVPAKRKRATRSTVKKPDKEAVDKGAAGTKKSAGGSKPAAKVTAKSSAKATSSKAKKATSKAPQKGKGKGKKDEQPKNRSKAQLRKPKITAQFDVRRILAQRDVGDESFYQVDWYPSWVKAKAVRQPNIDDWEGNEARTFQWGEDTVYKVGNPTSDTSPDMARQVLESVLEKYQTYMNQPPAEVATDLFEHDDWEFFSNEDHNDAVQAAADADDHHPEITAAEVMQHTFIEAWNEMSESPDSSPARRYGNIRVQFTGEIDEQATSHLFQPEEGITTVELIAPIFAEALWDDDYMKVSSWDVQGTDTSQAPAHLNVLQPLVADLVTQCPYLLKKPWPLMFISLFHWDVEIKMLLADSDFVFELQGAAGDPNCWSERMRDLLMYTYVDECDWEMRCMDEVNESFVQAQEFIEGSLQIARRTAGSGGDGGGDEGPSAAPKTKSKGKGKAAKSGQGKGKGTSGTKTTKGKGKS
ncbi:hypothetical protein EKO04_008013 [Ascochyta lentis]|uniref:Uncharacterized protein n=1 Tax=Ascochyta lentis TaxID=205686 RepID=A0A8H7IZV1_9PLEO|nr:hypothetical protein EKO04_008013 [Ascochyta lentis]